jgi:hypothetical protein
MAGGTEASIQIDYTTSVNVPGAGSWHLHPFAVTFRSGRTLDVSADWQYQHNNSGSGTNLVKIEQNPAKKELIEEQERTRWCLVHADALQRRSKVDYFAQRRVRPPDLKKKRYECQR